MINSMKKKHAGKLRVLLHTPADLKVRWPRTERGRCDMLLLIDRESIYRTNGFIHPL